MAALWTVRPLSQWLSSDATTRKAILWEKGGAKHPWNFIYRHWNLNFYHFTCHKIQYFLKVWYIYEPLDCKEIQPVHPKGNQSWIFIERSDAEAEPLILWPPDAKSWLIWKDSDVGKDWRQEKGTTEDETVGWHHWLNGHEFEQAPGVGDGQGSLVCCSPWGLKESDMTEWTELNFLWDVYE